jgi:hypothetical protein
VYDIGADAATARRLTDDPFADLQPAWSPDGTELAFVTERFSTNLDTLAIGSYGLAVIDVATGAVRQIDTGLDGGVINPQWSPDGTALYFVSNARGRPSAYRIVPGQPAERWTATATGVAGITPTSPALSIAARTGTAAVTVFHDGGYEIQIVEPAVAAAALTGAGPGPELGNLPPAERPASRIAALLEQPTEGLPPDSSEPADTAYSSGLELVGVGSQVGVATGSAYGTYLNGGVALQFSDVLGNHIVGVSASVNGDLADIGGGVSYLNRTRRWNWGLFVERAPLLTGFGTAGFTTIGGQTVFVEETQLSRQTYQQAGAVLAYPFSRSLRAEVRGMFQHIGFDREIRTRLFDPDTGIFLGETREDLPSAESLAFGAFGAALVRDTSVAGAVGPVLGQRARLEVVPTVGSLSMTTVTADRRQYVMPVRPITLAGRVLHFGRYGSGGEDSRLVPLFLGYPTLVRGYDASAFDAAQCSPTTTGRCPELDRLIGSRLLVLNGEVRAPAVGLFKGTLDYGPVPVELFGFADAGIAWTRAEGPSFANGPRRWISSVGAGARVNLFGFAIGEFNLVRPLNLPGKGWTFVFNFRPAF